MDFGLLELLLIGCIALVLVRAKTSPRPAGLRGRIRDRGWGLVLLLAAVMAAAMAGGTHPLAAIEPAIAVTLLISAPRLAAKLAPYAVLGLAVEGLILAKDFHDDFTNPVQYGLVKAASGSWFTHLLLPEAGLFFVFGLWLLLQVDAPGAGLLRALITRWLDPRRGPISPAFGLLLIPVTVMTELLIGPRYWFGMQFPAVAAIVLIDAAIATASLILVFRSRIWAATVAEAALLVLGVYGLLIPALYPDVPGFVYGLMPLDVTHHAGLGGALQGTALVGFGLWLAPRVLSQHQDSIELAERASQLTQRVETLTQTRSVAVDTAAAELRRIERDLHDGAQARLVAVGMSLQAAERLFASNPEAALALVGEAKESSSRALTELRDLVRGIYPPVLADRGLGDAIRALALDTPLPVTVHANLPAKVELPVASAVYFSVAEALANVTKHAGARSVRIGLSHRGGMLRAEVTDDGAGGADLAAGTGLAGVERRLATFDGILAVSSPPGGPTIVVIEVPCASSSAKTSSC
jgi:signal transduction histidine kinase